MSGYPTNQVTACFGCPQVRLIRESAKRYGLGSHAPARRSGFSRTTAFLIDFFLSLIVSTTIYAVLPTSIALRPSAIFLVSLQGYARGAAPSMLMSDE